MTVNASGTWTIPAGLAFNHANGEYVAIVVSTTWLDTLLASANNLSDVANAGTARGNIHIPALASCQAVAVANVNISSPGSTFGGFTLTNAGTDQALLTAQSTGSQDGPWVWNGPTSPLTRPTDYSSGATIKGRTVQINNGSGAGVDYDQTIWVLATNATITVDTTSTAWASLGLASSVQTLTPSVSGSGYIAQSQVGPLKVCTLVLTAWDDTGQTITFTNTFTADVPGWMATPGIPPSFVPTASKTTFYLPTTSAAAITGVFVIQGV